MTLGWIVLLQVGVVLLDRFHYGTPLPAGAWVAIVVVMAAQGYLVLARPAPVEASPEVAIAEAANADSLPTSDPRAADRRGCEASAADRPAPPTSGSERAR